MPQQIEDTLPENPAASVDFFVSIWSICKAFGAWFYPSLEAYPPDEAGVRIKLHMAEKSWFDKISSAWYERSFLSKIAYASLFIVGSSFVGLLAGSTILLTISAALLSIIIHKLLVSHEQHRWQAAHRLAEEEIVLINELQATQVLLNDATAGVNVTQKLLKDGVQLIQEQVEKIEPEIAILHHENERLAHVAVGVENDTTNLVQHQENVCKGFASISEDLDIYHEQIKESGQLVVSIGESATQFSRVVTAVRESNVKFADVVSKIGFLASQRPPEQEPNIAGSNDFINELMREAEETQLVIDSIMAREQRVNLNIH
jgi:hypothetical protein